MKPRIQKLKLTVIFRNDAPMIHCGDAPSYRTEVVNLTPEQCEKLRLHPTHGSGEIEFYEEISRSIIEELE